MRMNDRVGQIGTMVRGVVVATLFVALWVWLASLVRRCDPFLATTVPDWLRPVGWVLFLVGAAIAAWCVAVFITRGRGTPAPFDPPQEFVASGPYRYVRNPMYIGAILALSGSGLVVGSAAIVLLAGVFWLLAHILVLVYEEPDLQRRFGAAYARYKREVRRWLPRTPPPQH